MKQFIPYFSLFKGLRLKFAASVICGMLFALTSGLGMPLMIQKVFPIIFTSSEISDVHSEMAGEVGEEKAKEWLERAAPSQLKNLEETENTRNFIESIIGPQSSQKYMVIAAASFLPLMTIFKGAFGFLNVYLMTAVGLEILLKLKQQVFEKLQRMPIQYFSTTRGGSILGRVMIDAEILKETITTVANDLIKQPFTLIAAVFYLGWDAYKNQESFFILVCVISLPITVIPIRRAGKLLMGRFARMQENAAAYLSVLTESVSAAREIRAFNLESLMAQRFLDGQRKVQKMMLKVITYRNISPPIIEVIAAIAVATALGYGSGTGFTLERFLPVVIALYACYEPIKKLAGIHTRIKQGEVALARLEKLLKAEDGTKDPENPVPLKKATGSITFENVNFGYDRKLALKDINVEIPAGQVVALVGPSGAGKTTFASMVPRFYDPRRGSVKLDGVDVRDFRVTELRDQITLVPQEAILLAGTVEENIQLGRMDAKSKEIKEAARLAGAHDFIMSKKEGYKTQVGERGLQLSGGQKQRVSIARAFLKDAPVLILDEATASLDAESEAKLQNELVNLTKGRTTLIVAHRFSSIKVADRVLVFDEGRIVGDGTFQELSESHSLFKLLLEKQKH